MQKINFNDGWHYGHIGKNDKTAIDLPHDAMLCEKRSYENPGGKNISWFEGHDYWYEKSFDADNNMLSNKVFIEFEGVYHNAEVFINDEKLGVWPYGYSRFFFELTGKLKRQGNVLRVLAKNSQQPNSRWYTGSGIYRPVKLYLLPEKHIELYGIRIKTLDYSQGKIEIQIKANSPGEAEIEIFDVNKPVLSTQEFVEDTSTFVYNIPDAKLWSADSPFLYTAKIIFSADRREVTFGIRDINLSAADGLLINGNRVILKGACVHHDNGLLGACAYEFAEKRKIWLLKQAGYNAIRSAHNPCSKAMLEACDELGMYVMDEFADCWYIHKTKYDYVNYFEDWWQKDLISLVEKDMNHPSVIMYSIGNEVSETAQEKGIKFTGELTRFLHRLDGTRPVTCGVNIFFNYLSSIGFGVYSDRKAEKEAKDKPRKKEKAVGSEFFNKVAGILGDKTMKNGARLRGCDRTTRDAFEHMDAAGYNYGILRYLKDVKKYPERIIIGTETFCSDAYKFIQTAKKHKTVVGDFVWAGIDYLGEVGLGAQEYKDYAKDFNYGPGWISAGSGRLDLTGSELGEAAYTKVVFGIENINIASVPANNYANKHTPSAWRMTNARCSWSWNGSDGNKTRVEVYAKAHTVALFLNGKMIKKKKASKNLATHFVTRYFPGELKAVAYDKDGNKTFEKSLVTAGENTVLNAYPEESEIGWEGLAYFRFKYTDSDGRLKPLTRGEIKIDVSGGRLLAFGNACPYNEEGYLNSTADTYYGEALAIVKPESDIIKIKGYSYYGECEADVKVE